LKELKAKKRREI